jgi:endogenous inhibitor of DNA gyrase (YacG/DUF329 family)
MIHKCPICKKPTDSAADKLFPFCSEECSVRDLGNWATEKYVVSEPVFDEDDIVRLERQLADDASDAHDREH